MKKNINLLDLFDEFTCSVFILNQINFPMAS